MKVILLSLIAFCAFAQIKKSGNDWEIEKNKVDLKSLARSYAIEKDLNLTIPHDFKNSSIEIYGSKIIKKDEIDKFVSKVFFEQGYTFIIRDSLLQVVNMRDVRYQSVKMYKDIKKVPRTYNIVQYTTNTTHIPSRDISMNLRPFMGRYGRIIDESNGQSIVVQDSALNIHRVHQIIKLLDTPLYQKRLERLRAMNKKLDPELVYEESLTEVLSDQHVLFIILFSLLSLVIGFGIRGYLMKRIEGGW